MTHNVSRRTLAKGATWAAPAVVATAAIPAYAGHQRRVSERLWFTFWLRVRSA